MTYEIYNEDNHSLPHVSASSMSLVYADFIYDDYNFEWMNWCYEVLKDDGSIFIQTDYRSVAEAKLYLDRLFGRDCFVNWIIWPYDWGGRSKRRFARKHDDILWYSKGDNYKFYPERVAIPKKTANTSLNPSGRDWKIPTDVWDDIGNFHTMDKERIKGENNKNIRWQKPLRLIDRIILACTDPGDWVLDPYMGTGTTGESCIHLDRNFIGYEIDKFIFSLAKERLEGEK